MLMYPDAGVPVVQVSIDPTLGPLGPSRHLKLARRLRRSGTKGRLSSVRGSLTHNLHEFRGRAPAAEAPEWVTRFGEWMARAIAEGRKNDILNYRDAAPDAVRNHPTDEHLLPLFAAMGRAGSATRGERIHSSHRYGVIAMDAYAFQ